MAQEVFGIDWEEELEEIKIEDLQRKAEKLWKKSGFDSFLNGAIAALMAEAAPRCLESALKMALGRLEELNNEVQLRNSAMNEDEDKLKREVETLEADLESLANCRNRLQEVDKLRSNLYQQLNKILEKLKQDAKVELATYFSEKEYQHGDLIKKGGMTVQSFFNWLSKRVKSDIKPTGTGIIEFKTLREAEDFTEQAIAYPKEKTNLLLDRVREQVRKIIEDSREKLTYLLDKETKPIIEKARDRLNENFHVNLSLPTPNQGSKYVDFAKPRIRYDTRWVEQGYETQEVKTRSFFHWFWLVPKEEIIQVKKPDKKEEYYTVSLQEIVDESNKMIEQSVQNIKNGVNKYLDEDFQQKMDNFFENLNHYLSNYCDSLIQAQSNQQLQVEEKEKLVSEFSYLTRESREKIKKLNAYLEYAGFLMRDR